MYKVKLGDLCTKESSNIKQSDLVDNIGCYPIYGAAGLIKNVDFYVQEKPYIAVVKDGAGVGRVMNLPAYSSVIGTMQYIIPNDKVDVSFLAYAMEHMNLSKYYMGAAIPHIYFKDYKEEMLYSYNLESQLEIVKRLNAVERIIRARKEQVDKLDELIKSRFVEMFGDETNPKNWALVEVKDIAEVSVGVVIKPAQYYTDKEKGIKAFRSLNIGEMTIKDTEWVYFSHEGNIKNSKSQLKENDLLIIRSGAPGTACLVTKEYEGCNAIDIIIARVNSNTITPSFLCFFTNMPHGKRQIKEGIGGAAQQHFNVGKYKNLNVFCPPIDLQNQFADFVTKVEQQKATVQKSIDRLETLKKSLMQEYFG